MFNAFMSGWWLSSEGYNAEYTGKEVDVDADLEAEFDALWIAMQSAPAFKEDYPCKFED